MAVSCARIDLFKTAAVVAMSKMEPCVRSTSKDTVAEIMTDLFRDMKMKMVKGERMDTQMITFSK